MIIATAVATLCVSPAFAGPKDQTKDSLIGPQADTGNATVNNDTTAFSFQAKGCKVQIKAKGLVGVSDGDVIICVAGADVIAPPAIAAPGAGNGIVLLGEVKSLGLGIKADLTEVGCGSSNQINFNGQLSCYLDDTAYRATVPGGPNPVGGWQADCADTGAPGAYAPVPNPNCLFDGPPDTGTCHTTKAAGLPVIVGLCQGFPFLGAGIGGRLTGPPAGLIAVRGSRGFAIP
ncbi:MAG TPA: hypothetical protein VL049_07530 [Candidatus Dormibacteraeota bacterium]|nr:hypothetical protein [Candidatus Dormibacteraeota bacterium]